LAKAKNSSAAFSSRPNLLSGSIMIRPRADNSTAPAARKGAVKAGEAEFCEKTNYLTALCAAGHTSTSTSSLALTGYRRAGNGPQPWDCQQGRGRAQASRVPISVILLHATDGIASIHSAPPAAG
jgi:hypothetical protein